MFPSNGKPPPLSPVLLAGIAARPVSPRLLQPVLDHVMKLLGKRHPDLFERLSCLDDPTFLIDPIDLPVVFHLDATPERSYLEVSRSIERPAAAVIRGPLMTLLDLLEGRMDGDALFFSRALAIEGDTEAVVALRNAVDDSGIDLRSDVLASFGPFAKPAHRALGIGGKLYNRMSRDLDMLKAAIQQPQPKGPQA